ncbi:MAG: DUF4330 domain-containing protein [Clostridia bacterium]|nr:DUF4330 domain-containing protein [Clostridia bacterium]
MRLMDEKGRIFGKINIFDLIVLLVVILGVAFMLLRPTAEEKQQAAAPRHTAVIVMEIEGVRDYIAEAYHVGDTVYEGTTEIGVIKEIEVAPQKVVKLQPDGSYKEVERKLYFDMKLTLETDEYYENEGQFVDGKGMLCGTNHTITTGFAKNDAAVRSIKIIED